MTRPIVPDFAPEHLWNSLVRHWRKALAVFLLVIGAATAITFLAPRSYRSQAELFLRLGRENVTLDPTATLGTTPVVAVPPSRENEVNSVIEMLQSPLLLEQVVAKLGPAAILGRGGLPPGPAGTTNEALALPGDGKRSPWHGDPPLPGDDRYVATVRLKKNLEVENVKKSNIIRISYDGPSPEVAQAVVASLVDCYLAHHVHFNRTPGARRFLGEQTARLKDKLTRSEDALRKLKDETGLADPDAQRQTVVARIARLQDELLQAEGGIAAGEAATRLLRDKLTGLPPSHSTAVTKGFPNTAADGMRGQLYALQLKEMELKAKHADRHPELRLVRQQVAAAKAVLAREDQSRQQVTTGPNRLFEETQLALLREEPVLASLKARAEALRAQLAQEQQLFRKFTADQLRLARLKREVELQEGHYRKYADNLEQVQIDGALEAEKISNISIVQPASYDAKPVRPKPLVNLGVGLLLAVLASVGVALLSDYLTPAAKPLEVVGPRLDLPARAGIPDQGPLPQARNGMS